MQNVNSHSHSHGILAISKLLFNMETTYDDLVKVRKSAIKCDKSFAVDGNAFERVNLSS